MKILTGAQIRELDQYTIDHEPVESIELMERAARAITSAITTRFDAQTPVVVFAGPGNNGGDGLAVARMLSEKGYGVDTYLFNIHSELSDNCLKNRDRLKNDGLVKSFTEVTSNFDPPKLSKETLVIDALFGSGLNKPLTGGFASLVKYINQSSSRVVSIDMPSGLMTEDNATNNASAIIRADLTLTMQLKKLCMFFADCQPYLGKVLVLDIRLSKEYIKSIPSPYTTIDAEYVRQQMLQRDDFAHKGSMGHALLIAGSEGMAGAAVLATRACLRSGVGKVTALTPRCNSMVMQIAVPEAVLAIDSENYYSEAVISIAGKSMQIHTGETGILARISTCQQGCYDACEHIARTCCRHARIAGCVEHHSSIRQTECRIMALKQDIGTQTLSHVASHLQAFAVAMACC